MTVIIAQNLKDKIVLSADSSVFQGHNKYHSNNHINWRKIRQVNGITFSSCGLLKDIINFELYCSTRKPESNTALSMQRFFVDFKKWLNENKLITDNDSLNSNFFVVYDGMLFHYMEGAIYEIIKGEFQTDGAGKCESYMAMYLGKTPKEAVELTIKMNVWTSGETQIVEINK